MDKNTVKNHRQGERGSARVKFLLVVMILAITGNALLNYVPVAYQGENFKQEMQTIVVQGAAMPSNGPNAIDAMKSRLARAVRDSQLPPAVVDVRSVNNIYTAHVRYSKEVSIVPFGIYNYHYEFDHTATPTGFLTRN